MSKICYLFQNLHILKPKISYCNYVKKRLLLISKIRYLFQKFHIYLPACVRISYLFQNFQVPIPQKTQKPKMATIYQEMPKTLSQPCLVLRQQDLTAKILSNRKVRNIAK